RRNPAPAPETASDPPAGDPPTSRTLADRPLAPPDAPAAPGDDPRRPADARCRRRLRARLLAALGNRHRAAADSADGPDDRSRAVALLQRRGRLIERPRRRVEPRREVRDLPIHERMIP